jgi:hypothetical protein
MDLAAGLERKLGLTVVRVTDFPGGTGFWLHMPG